MAAGKANVYEMVTARIIAELEKGNIPWEKPWTGTQTGAFNRISKKPYSLINQMLLLHTGEYATFKQWADLGGHVRKRNIQSKDTFHSNWNRELDKYNTTKIRR